MKEQLDELDIEAQDKIIRARVTMQTENPFFSYLVMGLEPIQKNKACPSCAVDNEGRLYYNSKFVNKLNQEELKTVMAHEVLHVALLHLTRISERKVTAWNIACDVVVNNTLRNNNFEFTGELKKCFVSKNNKITAKGLKNNLIITDIDKKFVEEVYDEIRKFIEEESKHFFDKFGKLRRGKEGEYNDLIDKLKEQLDGFDQHKHSRRTKENQGDLEKNERKWKRILSEAHMQSKQQGKSPAGMDRYVDEVLEPKINWRQILYRYTTREIPFDYSFFKPNKRSIATGIYMPSTIKENIDITVAVDTSGSIDQKDLTEFLSEIISIANSFEAMRVHLLFWDTQLNNYYEIDKYNINEILEVKIGGGGGTVFTDIYKTIEKKVPNTKLLIFFTDGYANFPKEEKYKTLWILSKDSCSEKDIPFGDTVKMYP